MRQWLRRSSRFLAAGVIALAVVYVARPVAQSLPRFLVYGVNPSGVPRAVSVNAAGALEINASISGADGAILDGVSTAIRNTVLDLTNSNPVTVAIVNATGDQISSFGGGQQYVEDAAAAADPTGTAPMLVRQDTPVGIASANGDNVAQRGTNFGAAFTQILTSSGAFVDTFGGGAQFTHSNPLTPDSTAGTMAMGRASATAPSTTGIAADDAVLPWYFPSGQQAVTLVTAAGAEILTADVAEDSPETANVTGPMVLSVRRDAAASSASTTGDNATFNTDSNGLLWSRDISACSGIQSTPVPISVTADTAVITASANNRNYICGGLINANAAETISIWEGTGTACGTSSAAIIGSTTEANGVSLAANGGFVIAQPLRGISTNVDTCIRLSGSNRVTGYISVVQAP